MWEVKWGASGYRLLWFVTFPNPRPSGIVSYVPSFYVCTVHILAVCCMYVCILNKEKHTQTILYMI
jgi:hypothetical protein